MQGLLVRISGLRSDIKVPVVELLTGPPNAIDQVALGAHALDRVDKHAFFARHEVLRYELVRSPLAHLEGVVRREVLVERDLVR